MAAIHVAGVRGDPCGALRWTAVHYKMYGGLHVKYPLFLQNFNET